MNPVEAKHVIKSVEASEKFNHDTLVKLVALESEVRALQSKVPLPLDKKLSAALGPWTKWEQSVDFVKKNTTSVGSFKLGGAPGGTAKFTMDEKSKVDISSLELGFKGFTMLGGAAQLTVSPYKGKATLKAKGKPAKNVSVEVTQPLVPSAFLTFATPGIVVEASQKGPMKGSSGKAKVDLVKYTGEAECEAKFGAITAGVKAEKKKDVAYTGTVSTKVGKGELSAQSSLKTLHIAEEISYKAKVDKLTLTAKATVKKKELEIKGVYKGALEVEGIVLLDGASKKVTAPKLVAKRTWTL